MAGPIFDPTLAALGRALDLRQRQHALVSSNIANADVPNYRAQRLDFRAAFEQAIGDEAGAGRLRATSPLHVQGEAAQSLPVVELAPPGWSEDGNSVNPEEEMVVLVENNLLFNATVEVTSRRLALLEYAASDGGK